MTANWGYTYLQTAEDHLWFDEGLRRGWELPVAASPMWRAPVVRHLRAFCMVFIATYHFRDDWITLWRKEWIGYAIKKGWV